MLSLPIGSQGFKTIAGRHPKIAQYPGLIQKTQLSEGDVLMSAGNFRLRRPDQISSASESAKP
jgi:hypothetical protein